MSGPAPPGEVLDPGDEVVLAPGVALVGHAVVGPHVDPRGAPLVRERIDPGPTGEAVAGVGARALEHRVVAVAPVELIRALTVVQEVVARATPEEVAVHLAVELVRSVLPQEVVGAGAPVDAIRVGVPDQEVASLATRDVLDIGVHVVRLGRLAVVRDIVEVDIDGARRDE